MRSYPPGFPSRLVVASTVIAGLWLAATVAGCKKTDDGAGAGASSGSSGQAGKAADGKTFIYVSPAPIGVNPFLGMGKTGIEAAAAKYGASARTFQAEDPITRKENLRAAVAEGATLVSVLGFQFNDIVVELAGKHPEVHFLIVDHCLDDRPDNLHCAVFREYEQSFLLGAVAASLSQSNRLGVVCALDIPFMHRFTDGFAQGARHVKPDIAVDVRWVGGQNPFADPVRAKELALALHGQGADIIYAATSGGDYGVFEAAAEKDFRVVGVDVDHCPNAPGRMIDSALKKLDFAMVDAIDKIMTGGKKVSASYGLAEGGAGLIALEDGAAADNRQCTIFAHPDVITLAGKLRDDIVAGRIKLEDPMFAGQ